jgi:heat shock protein HslJ
MKKIIVFSSFLIFVLGSCNCSKSTSSKSTASTANSKKADDKVVPVTSNESSDELDLEGTWELVSIISETTSFKALYPNEKPTISFDSRPKQISGSTSCNTYTGSYAIDGRNISFGNGMALTKMACQGTGESVYMERLNKVNKVYVKDHTTLMLLSDDVALLEFKKTMGPKSY